MKERTNGTMWRVVGVVIGAVLVMSSSGCALFGGDDAKSGEAVTAVPSTNDTITMRNGDVITGDVDLDWIVLTTPYMPAMRMNRDSLDVIEFFSEREQVRIRTKSGDLLRGTIEEKDFRVNNSGLPHTPVLSRDDVRSIRFR